MELEAAAIIRAAHSETQVKLKVLFSLQASPSESEHWIVSVLTEN